METSATELAPGATVGRYVVVAKVGAGGMGVVYAARDPELQRTVALKLLHDAQGVKREQRQRRLLAEARAMARLSHPNVIAVHDVGEADEGVFVAMELVDGGTLRDWLDERRGWREVVERFLAAGRGLAAAHEAGLVHRDFKPDNVLVGSDGRVRVTDFGLARAAAAEDVSGESPAARASTMAGTPAYMSPEQHLGVATTAASDQFSFAVALYEGLYRQSPFAPTLAGPTLPAMASLAVEVVSGRLAEAPANSEVPERVRRVVVRALAVDPAARWPSMTELLAALERAARRRRWPVVAAASLLVLGGVALAGVVGSRRAALCRGFEHRLDGVWDAPVVAEVDGAFLGTQRADAPETARLVRARLDAYAAALTAMRVEACAATRVRGDQSDVLLDLRTRCLDRRTADLRALAALFAKGPDRDVLDRAVAAAAALPPIAGCADATALRAAYPPPTPAQAPGVTALEARLDEATALERAGKYAAGLGLASEVTAGAREAGYPPLLARSLFVTGLLSGRAGDPAAAEKLLYEAVEQAALARDDRLAATVDRELIYVLGQRGAYEKAAGIVGLAQAQVARSGGDELLLAEVLKVEGDLQEGRGQFAEAEATLRRALKLREAGGPDDLALPPLLLALAGVERDLGNLDEARALAQRALDLTISQLGAKHPSVSSALGQLALLEYEAGRYPAAAELLERALHLKIELLGPDHPNVAITWNVIGNNEDAQGHIEAARAAYQRALAIREQALGPDHPLVARTLGNLAGLEREVHAYARARELAERALAINIKAVGEEHVNVAFALVNLGDIALDDGRPADALAHYQRALAIRRKVLPPDHADVAKSIGHVGRAQQALGQVAQACASFDESVAILRKKLAPGHPTLVAPLILAGECRMTDGRARDALPLLREAVDAGTAARVAPRFIAAAKFDLAQAQWDTGGDRAGALALAAEARPAIDSEMRPALDAWLAARRK